MTLPLLREGFPIFHATTVHNIKIMISEQFARSSVDALIVVCGNDEDYFKSQFGNEYVGRAKQTNWGFEKAVLIQNMLKIFNWPKTFYANYDLDLGK